MSFHSTHWSMPSVILSPIVLKSIVLVVARIWGVLRGFIHKGSKNWGKTSRNRHPNYCHIDRLRSSVSPERTSTLASEFLQLPHYMIPIFDFGGSLLTLHCATETTASYCRKGAVFPRLAPLGYDITSMLVRSPLHKPTGARSTNNYIGASTY